ncbi:T9SS type B sorting domain-containing protein [Aestuariibaculum suncheonense]|uniref:T9SS type B sorting domain-containing protein n=1 Tax=Aestuariibaculum suncheonense TaxID=1028745 RepID=A0A8J6Q5V8_9FLAO|nr:choice-of-anchor L domain-containing protein [Aestuariibaculum suncheonense]MBD0834907.1 T9SS type B sorting domain-containing protein [Aestuariibaculum suncheonense]
MKHLVFLSFLFISSLAFSQNVQVDSQTYTAQQLIEDILIGSNCISNVVVTNVRGGNFNGTDQSYGYFDASGSTFPFQSGVVLSTGKLSNVPGPNSSLSDDDAINWDGDSDLEFILKEGNTTNATIIEFEFTATASQISFRYLFASEEYQENNSNTCRYSDLFGFLIRNANEQQYTNIALIPNTQTPVKVTTVHPEIPGGCAAQNEAYFGSWNDSTAPINFNGQTTVLTATANTIPNETFHVKLVIADAQNYRYDSAVFLEAGSFKLNTDIGENRLLTTDNPLCENETLLLDASASNGSAYKWFKDGIEIQNETNSSYTASESATYTVKIDLGNNCISYGEITIEYIPNPIVSNTTLIACDDNQDGLTIYNLLDTEQTITNGDDRLVVSNFYTSLLDAENQQNDIQTPSAFENVIPQQIVYARIENQNQCFSIAEIALDISTDTITIPPFETCDDTTPDGLTTFNLDDLRLIIQPNTPANATINFYKTTDNLFSEMNPLPDAYENTSAYAETIWVKIENGIDCYVVSSVDLIVLESPQFSTLENVGYCLNSYPETITIDSGLLNAINNNPTYQWYLNNSVIPQNTSTIAINETGRYTVTVTFNNGCSESNSIEVKSSNLATIENITITQASENNTITITTSGEGKYQFALDNSSFQDSNTFINVTVGIHTVYVNDINGCGMIQKQISVLGFPKYFTPNGDGINDFWKPYGVTSEFHSDINIKIFNRYGNFIKQINPSQSGWNGTLRGQPLANDDYWYHVVLKDGTKYTGHFSLKR